jgi:hypothetical protein
MFKVGDKVVRIEDGVYSKLKGKVMTVNKVSVWTGQQWLGLDGADNKESFDECPFLASSYRLAKYSEYFTEPTPTPSTGHVADSPIQKRSVGDIYPLAVVCYADGDKQRFVIENLERGTVAVSSLSGYSVLQWNRAVNAHKFAELGGKCSWAKGRPVYGQYGGLVLPAKVREAQRTVINLLTVNGAYYQALEQDIG